MSDSKDNFIEILRVKGFSFFLLLLFRVLLTFRLVCETPVCVYSTKLLNSAHMQCF